MERIFETVVKQLWGLVERDILEKLDTLSIDQLKSFAVAHLSELFEGFKDGFKVLYLIPVEFIKFCTGSKPGFAVLQKKCESFLKQITEAATIATEIAKRYTGPDSEGRPTSDEKDKVKYHLGRIQRCSIVVRNECNAFVKELKMEKEQIANRSTYRTAATGAGAVVLSIACPPATMYIAGAWCFQFAVALCHDRLKQSNIQRSIDEVEKTAITGCSDQEAIEEFYQIYCQEKL